MKTTLQPLRNFILIEPIFDSLSSIIVATDVKPSRGKVLAVGSGTVDKKGAVTPIPVTVGQTILFSKGAAEKHKVDGQDFWLLSAEQLIGVEV